MKNKILYLLCAMMGCSWLAGCGGDTTVKTIPDLTETYSYIDKKPFGAYIAYHQLGEMLFRNTIREEKNSFEESDKKLEDTASIYICISRALYTTEEDVSSIVDFAEKGNDVFLAAGEFDNYLLDKLGCKAGNEISLGSFTGLLYNNTGVKLSSAIEPDKEWFRYFYLPFTNRFYSFDKSHMRILGVNENGDPDYIVIFKGRGRIFLHCEPRAFSNYFLLQHDNYKYLEKVFGFLNDYPEHVYWNNYYVKLHSREQARRNRGRDSNFSSLSEIMNQPPLAAAFWLILAMLLLYILFGMKRRQRIIEIIKPNENTTVTFTETIGRLYLQKKDNKNIADKMITYFNEYIRNKFFLNTNSISDDFITTLSRKSGVVREKVDSLYRAIDHAQHQPDIDDFQLMSLNEQMQDFFKRAK